MLQTSRPQLERSRLNRILPAALAVAFCHSLLGCDTDSSNRAPIEDAADDDDDDAGDVGVEHASNPCKDRPGNGWYCEQPDSDGDGYVAGSDLIKCSNRSPAASAVCANGCNANHEGVDDSCRGESLPVQTCAAVLEDYAQRWNGAGAYCQRSAPAGYWIESQVIHCDSNGNVAGSTKCPDYCSVASAGEADACASL